MNRLNRNEIKKHICRRMLFIVMAILGTSVSHAADHLMEVPGTLIMDEATIYRKIPFSSGGKKYTVYFCASNSNLEFRDGEKVIDHIYVVPDNYKSYRYKDTGFEITHPGEFKKLMVHIDGNPDKAFGGMIVEYKTYDINSQKRQIIQHELKLPDDVTNTFFDIFAGDTDLIITPKKLNEWYGGDITDMTLSKPEVLNTITVIR